MLEIGVDDVPIMPTIRELTVTKKKPKTTTNSPISSLPGIPPARKLGKDRDDENQRQRAEDYIRDRHVALGPRRRHARFHIAQAFKALSERPDDCGQGSNQRDQTAGGHSAG